MTLSFNLPDAAWPEVLDLYQMVPDSGSQPPRLACTAEALARASSCQDTDVSLVTIAPTKRHNAADSVHFQGNEIPFEEMIVDAEPWTPALESGKALWFLGKPLAHFSIEQLLQVPPYVFWWRNVLRL